jgi:hypothetical protein
MMSLWLSTPLTLISRATALDFRAKVRKRKGRCLSVSVYIPRCDCLHTAAASLPRLMDSAFEHARRHLPRSVQYNGNPCTAFALGDSAGTTRWVCVVPVWLTFSVGEGGRGTSYDCLEENMSIVLP